MERALLTLTLTVRHGRMASTLRIVAQRLDGGKETHCARMTITQGNTVGKTLDLSNLSSVLS